MEHCGSFLQAAVSNGPPPEHTWARSADAVDCTCAACKSLADFLMSPTQQMGRIEKATHLERHFSVTLPLPTFPAALETLRLLYNKNYDT